MTDLRTAAQQALEALIENARLLGGTQAKKAFGCYSQEDANLERAWHEGIAKHSATIRAALAQQADRMRAKWEAVGAAVEGADRDSRGMFVARLENMQKHGDHWLTVQAVLALLNDCDMLAARERA